MFSSWTIPLRKRASDASCFEISYMLAGRANPPISRQFAWGTYLVPGLNAILVQHAPRGATKKTNCTAHLDPWVVHGTANGWLPGCFAGKLPASSLWKTKTNGYHFERGRSGRDFLLTAENLKFVTLRIFGIDETSIFSSGVDLVELVGEAFTVRAQLISLEKLVDKIDDLRRFDSVRRKKLDSHHNHPKLQFFTTVSFVKARR